MLTVRLWGLKGVENNTELSDSFSRGAILHIFHLCRAVLHFSHLHRAVLHIFQLHRAVLHILHHSIKFI